MSKQTQKPSEVAQAALEEAHLWDTKEQIIEGLERLLITVRAAEAAGEHTREVPTKETNDHQGTIQHRHPFALEEH
ncbi:hypothetical protein [Rhodococcus aetherivorans]|uniref:hypothetical protein n=1 Tax=Rhodococcus aetherivorans TaxID=191292 RepID=UPI00388FC2F8